MKFGDLTPLQHGVFEVEKGCKDRKPSDGDGFILHYGCIETEQPSKEFAQDAEVK